MGLVSEQGDDNYNGGVCMCVALALLSVCVSIMRACVRVSVWCAREELQGCFNSRRKEAVSEWRPGR